MKLNQIKFNDIILIWSHPHGSMWIAHTQWSCTAKTLQRSHNALITRSPCLVVDPNHPSGSLNIVKLWYLCQFLIIKMFFLWYDTSQAKISWIPCYFCCRRDYSLSVCLSVQLSAGLHKNHWTNLNGSLWNATLAQGQIHYIFRSGSSGCIQDISNIFHILLYY